MTCGLASVKLKSLACLIRNFVEIAVNSRFINSSYETAFYNYYVRGIQSHQPPLRPPFYTDHLFQAIKDADVLGLDVINMKIKQWYSFLMKREYSEVIDDALVMRPSRIELLVPTAQWNIIWRNVHLKVLSSAEISFSWKLVHNLLPTEERVHETVRNAPASCKFLCPGEAPANLEHCLLSCCMTSDVGSWLVRVLQLKSPGCTVHDMLRLQISGDDALLWFVIKTLFFCWSQRMTRKRADQSKCISFLLADLRLLIETNHSTLVKKIEDVLNLEAVTNDGPP